jgi:hypothetical protein
MKSPIVHETCRGNKNEAIWKETKASPEKYKANFRAKALLRQVSNFGIFQVIVSIRSFLNQ